MIGNPPYIRIQNLQEFQPDEANYYKKTFSSGKGSFDIYILFIEKGLEVLKDNGVLGYICPHKFFNSEYGVGIRNLLSVRKFVSQIINFGDIMIFNNVSNYTCLLFLKKSRNDSFNYIKIDKKKFNFSYKSLLEPSPEKISSDILSSAPWNIHSKPIQEVLLKIQEDSKKLIDITQHIFQGPISGADAIFILKLIEKRISSSIYYSKSLKEEVLIEDAIMKKYIKGRYIKKYNLEHQDEYIIYPYNEDAFLFDEKTLSGNFPNVYKYLSRNKASLISRENKRFAKIWWSYSRPQNLKIIKQEKIITPFNAFSNSFSLDSKGDFIFSAGVAGGYGIILKENISLSLKFLIGVLNSKLVQYFIYKTSTPLRGGFYSYENRYIKNIPLHPSVFSSSHDRMVALVETMLELHKRLADAKTEHEKTVLKRQIESTDAEIDALVYQLYGLTDKEIKIIEGE
ncbi:MAG: hypothetical protein Kow0090_12390 [Myxococcota bacterium]